MNLETYGMIIYGGVTTVLFLIVSVLAYKRLNDEHNAGKFTTPTNTVNSTLKANNDTLFPFHSKITSQKLQQIDAQPTNDESVTETSIMFNTNFWSSKYQNRVIPGILNEMNEFEFEPPDDNDDEDDAKAALNVRCPSDDEVVLNMLQNARYSLSNTHSHINITPQMVHPKLQHDKSSHLYHQTLSDPECIKHIHLQRQRSRHSLAHLAKAKRTCGRVTIEYFKEMLRNRSIYSPSLQHTWDVATDISVLLKWGKHAFQGTDMDHIDFVPLFWTSLFVQVGYRLVSGYAVYKSERSFKKAAMQVCDLLMLREIYVSHVDCRITDTLVYIKKLEAVLEAAPQLILTTYFFLRVGTLEHSYTEIIGWLWSFFTLSTKVINDDTKMYKHIKSRWNRQFMYRCLFRLFEICSRVMVIGLVATAVSARAAMVVIVIDLFFLLFSYYYGLLSNDKMNILGSLITFVDLTIYPKVSPLYSWYVSIDDDQKRLSRHHRYNSSLQEQELHHVQRPNKPVPSQSLTGSALRNLVTSTPFNHDHNDKSHGKFGKLFNFNLFQKDDHSGSTFSTARSNLCSLENSIKTNENEEEEAEKVHNANALAPSKLNLSIAVPRSENATIYVRPAAVHQGQLSVREKSSYLLKQMTSIEAVYLELQQEETFNKKYRQYKCCGCCCCWCKHCRGCLPQFIMHCFLNKCYHFTLCTSWVWCIYCLTSLCSACNDRTANKTRKMMTKRVQKEERQLDMNDDDDEEQPVYIKTASISQQLTLAIQNAASDDTHKEPMAPIPAETTQRVSFSDRFKQLKIKKVRFAEGKLKDRTKKKNTPNEEPVPQQLNVGLASPASNTITDSRSVQHILIHAHKKSYEVPDETSSDEEAPQDWWNSQQGSTKFAVATLRSLHSIDGGFPDLADGLTPVGEYKADKVYPVNSLQDVPIKEGSAEPSFPWKSPNKSEQSQNLDTESFSIAALVVQTSEELPQTNINHMRSITPFSNHQIESDTSDQSTPNNNLKVNVNTIEKATAPDTQQSGDSTSDESEDSISTTYNSDEVAMRIMMEILEYAGICVQYMGEEPSMQSDGNITQTPTTTDDEDSKYNDSTGKLPNVTSGLSILIKHSSSDSEQTEDCKISKEELDWYLGNLPDYGADSVGSSDFDTPKSLSITKSGDEDDKRSQTLETEHSQSQEEHDLDYYLGNLPKDTLIISMRTDSEGSSDISMCTNSEGSSDIETSKSSSNLQNMEDTLVHTCHGNQSLSLYGLDIPHTELSMHMCATSIDSTDSMASDIGTPQSSSDDQHITTQEHLIVTSEKKEHELEQDEIEKRPSNLDEYLGNLPRDMIIASRDDEFSISFCTDSVHLSQSPTASLIIQSDDTEEEHEVKCMATLLGITESDQKMKLQTQYNPVRNITIEKSVDSESQNKILNSVTFATTPRREPDVPIRNMAIEKSFEMFDSEQKLVDRHLPTKSIPSMSYAVSVDSIQSSNRSGNSTPFVPNDAYRHALLALAGLETNEEDRLTRLFTNPSALNTPKQKSECSTEATTPVFSGFPDIDGMPLSRGVSLRDMPLSRGVSLRDKSMIIDEEESEEKLDLLRIKIDPATALSRSVSALTLERSPSTGFNVEIVNDSMGDLGLVPIKVDVDNVSSGDIFATPHFTVNTPQAHKKDIKPFCGIKRFVFDGGIVHRYAFLVVLARTIQSLCLVPFIAYIVYINPAIFGGKDDIEYSNEYWIRCNPWCTSQSLRYNLRNSLVFMQFMIACTVTATLAIIFFLLSSPYLLFATSISRSPLSLLKTGCIYDSIQYFSKKARCAPLQILCDFNFMKMFFDEIIKRRIPVFYCEEKNTNDLTDKLHHKILKNADSEILLTALQLNMSAQLAETVAIRTVKEGYLHLLVFIMSCASMHNENRLMFDPSNCVDEDGNTLLHVAIIRGDEHIIQYALDVLGYDPRKNMSNQDTIDLLILHGDIHCLRLMLSFFKSAKRVDDLTKKTFYKSIKRGNMEFVVVLMEVLKKNCDPALWITSYIDRDKSEPLYKTGSFLTGRTLLMCTAMHGHANTTQWLLNTMQVDATKQDKEGKTALMHAAVNQNVNVIDVFIKHPRINSYINTTCNKGITALLYATMEGSLDCVCTLMQKRKLDPNVCGGIHEETALIHAARYGHQEIALQLIKAKKMDVNIQNNGGKTALMFAARYGLTKIVKELLSHDDIDVEIKDNEDKTALDHVEENLYLGEQYAIVKRKIQAYLRSKLQAQQVDPKRLAQKRRSFIMIGELAAQQINNKVKRRYSKSNRSGSRKAKSRRSKSMKSLHNHSNSIPSTPRSTRNRSKRRNKSRSKSILSVKLDVAEAPAPLVDILIDDVEFYLWYSIQMDYDNVCHWFLQNTRCGRDLVGREDLEMIDVGLVGKNPFHFAVKTDSDKCLRVLLEIDGMDKTETFVNEKDKEGFTPLVYAVMDGKMTIVELLLNYHDTEVNARDANQVTPLMHAAMRGYANIVQFLLDHKTTNDSVNYVDKKGQTALCLAVRYNRPRVVQLLLHQDDIEVDKARNNGRTPLMYAVKNGLFNIVNMLLLSNKVNVNKKDYIHGNTVEFYLDECKDESIAKEIASRLTFYKLSKRRQQSHHSNSSKSDNALQLRMLHDFILTDASHSPSHSARSDRATVVMRDEHHSDFYHLATKEIEIKRQNHWNMHSMESDIEDKLFNKWLMQLEILHVCAERHDDTVFKELWHHWIGPESIVTAIKLHSHHRSASSSATNLYDMLSEEWLSEADRLKDAQLLSEKDHFQDLKWYYFMVMISNKGWHRLFIRFIQEIEHKQIAINWKFIPSDSREIKLMAKHGHMDELQDYLNRMRNVNESTNNSNVNANALSCCCSRYSPQKHMQLMLESIFENFGQSANLKPKLGQCLRFVLAKTMSQYLFNSKLCD
eukprot:279133_1